MLPLDDHHKAGHFHISSRPDPAQRARPVARRDFRNADYISIKDALGGIDWSLSFSTNVLNEIANDVHNVLESVILDFVPLKASVSS